MNYLNNTNTENSIYHYATYLLGKSVTDSTSLPVEAFCRSANAYYRKAAYFIWRNTAGWEFDDSNYSDLPFGTTTLVNGRDDYTIPTNALSIERVEVLDSEGKYSVIKRIDKSDVTEEALDEHYSTNGMPREYDLVGNSIILYPTPATGYVTMASGLKVYVSRDISAPTPVSYTAGIAQEPGFQVIFHPYIAYGVAYDYGVSNNYTQEKMALLKITLQEYEAQLSDYYAKRDRDNPVKIKPKTRSSI